MADKTVSAATSSSLAVSTAKVATASTSSTTSITETPASTPLSAFVAPSAKQSSISVAVRVRPFTTNENNKLIRNDDDEMLMGDGCLSTPTSQQQSSSSQKKVFAPIGLRKIIKVVDDRMLIFDPPETNPIAKMQKNAFPNSFKGSRIREHKFVFDRLFDEDTAQDEVYHNTTKPLLDSVLDGYNATVFAYGATGCGKTHTILGTPEQPGVIFLTMKELYEKINELKDTKIIDVSLSYLEIYNETIRDLLTPETDFKKLIIREDSNQKISVSNLSTHRPNSVDEVMELILRGNMNRTSSPTEANATSSRSHAVLQINVVQKNRTGDITEDHTFATLSIIDLAGSERAAATKNRGARLNEGANINKSLLALGNCINALCDPRRRNHVPYRDSKLTRLLKFSLGGNCKTVMIVCVSPSSQHYDETLNTLKYADRAKEIKTKVMRNQQSLDRHVGSYLKMITEQKLEIEELRAREGKVIEIDREKQEKLRHEAFVLLQEQIATIKRNLYKNTQERCKKCLLLAKRKLLLLQKVQVEQLLLNANSGMLESNQESTIRDLCEQIVSKLNSQIPEIEEQYSQQYEVDYILGDSAMQGLSKLQNEKGWTEYHTTIYIQQLENLSKEVQTDQLVKSLALFDQLIRSMYEFIYLGIEGEIVNVLQNLVNGNFETALQYHASEYIRERLWYQQPLNNSAQHPLQQHDSNSLSSLPLKKLRGFKNNTHSSSNKTSPTRTSPLKTSPTRASPTRSSPMKPPLKRIKSSQNRKAKKVFRWGEGAQTTENVAPNTKAPDGPQQLHHQHQSRQQRQMDSSFDDTVVNTSALAMLDTLEQGSPTIDHVLDLDLLFNPVLESPQSPQPPQLQSTNLFAKSPLSEKLSKNILCPNTIGDERNQAEQKMEQLSGLLVNRRLNASLIELRRPLLNTLAASRLTQTED